MITRENYEEFFVLYVDNELPSTTRSAVEKFVADNPDLKEELTALLQCRVSPDQEPGFQDKDILFHYTSSLLSYVDGELDEQERDSVEEWVRCNPRAAEELRQLQLTVSQADPSIGFPDKESLYHRQRRKAVILPWLMAGVAAAVLGVAALLLLPKHDSSETTASISKKIPPAVTSVAPAALNLTKKDEGAPVKDRQVAVLPKTNEKQTQRKDEQALVVTTVKDERPKKKETNETPAEVTPAVKTEVAVGDPQSPKEQATSVAAEQTTLSTAVAAVNIPKEKSSFATQALLQQEQDNSIVEASATPAKNKLRGLFRKVGRAFGKTADSDSEGQREVLISAFQVALK